MSSQSSFKETPIGRIPNEWKIRLIGDIGKVVTGTTPSTKVEEYWGEGYPFVTPTDFTEDKYVYETERSVTKESAGERIIPKDSVMVTCIASVGEVSLAYKECLTNQQINSIICKEGIDPHYIYYSMTFRQDILRRWAGTTTSPIIKKSFFEKFPLPLPPLPEQRKIAEVISTVDEAIQKTSEVIAKTERLKNGLMQELLTKGIGHKEFKDTEIGRIPQEWEVVRLGNVLELLRNGLTYKQNKKGIGYPTTRIETISDGVIDLNKLGYIESLSNKEIEEYRLKVGDILFSHINSIKHFAKTAIYSGAPPLLIHGMNLLLLRPIKEKIKPMFLVYYLKYENTRNKLRRWAKRAVNQISLNQTELKRFKLFFPPLPEQQKIAEILSTVDKKLELEKKRKEKLERVKRGLMNDLLTGKVRAKAN